MIQLLARIFIPNRSNLQDPAVRRAYGLLCGAAGIFWNLLLFAAKYAAGIITGSIAITADAVNNLSDAGSSVVTLWGFRMAAQKPHSDHPYGHGRYEYIAGLIVSMVILIMGFDLGKSSVQKIIRPEAVDFSLLSVIILSASILVKLYMALYNRSIGKKIQSVALAAVAVDSLSDIVATGVVLISALVGRSTGLNIDGWAGAAVSLMILWAGFSTARDTISPLLGQAPDPEFVQKVHDIVAQYPDVAGMHDLMVHDYGAGQVMITLHAEVAAGGDLMALHEVIDGIERRLRRELYCHATIHMDPVCTDDEQVARTRALLEERIAAVLGTGISLHDFRMVTGDSGTKVIFDAVVPYEYPMEDRAVKQKLAELVQECGTDLRAVVTIDHPLTGRQ